ncbi:hypothetical protein BIW11_05551, partial [Tropilaelaps mercedesae]
GISTVFRPRHAPAFAFLEFVRASSAYHAVELCQSNCRDGPFRVAGCPVIVKPYKPHAKATHVEKDKFFWARTTTKPIAASVSVHASNAWNRSNSIEYSYPRSCDGRALKEFQENEDEFVKFDDSGEENAACVKVEGTET